MSVYKNIFFFVLLLGTITVTELTARIRTIQSEREFDLQLKQSHMLVALFYDGSHEKIRREKMRRLFVRCEYTSNKRLYDDADIVFTKLNIKNPSINNLIRRYNITNYPCFILFIDGNPVINKEGHIAQLTGFVSDDELQKFIQFYFSLDIDVAIHEKEYNEEERTKELQNEAIPYFYPSAYYAPEYDFSWQKPLKYNAEGEIE